MNNKYKISAGLIFGLAASFVSTHAQTPLSFKDCLNVGIEKNLSLQIVRNAELMASKNVDYSIGYFLPTIDARGTLTYSIMDSRLQRFSGEVQEKNGARSNSLSSSVNLNWNIFDGFAMFANRNRLKETLTLGQLNTRLNIENLMGQLGAAYFNYYQQQKRLKTLTYILQLSKDRLRISEEKYKIGNLSKLDYQQDRVEFNADSSRYLRQQEAIENARLTLINAMALPADSSFTITDTIEVSYGLIFDELKQQTMASNTSLLIVNQNKVLSEYDLKIINSRFYPTFFVTGAYVFNKSESQTGLTLENKQNGWNYGAGVSFPILNRFDARRQRSVAKIAIESAALAQKNVEIDIVADLTSIFNTYQNNIKVLELEKQNLQTALNNFTIAQERYRLGSLSGIEMRDIQRMYLDAEDRLLNAQYQAKLAEISLKQISGRIQEYL
ncbi:MAG TPA: TolC family protein [Bacteroidales bacterium]|nr:TolC family protein [Bacteroidales bacterium]